MPNDFVTYGNNAGNQRSMSLNLDALGDAAKQPVGINNGEKPTLNEEVEATVTLTDLKLMNELQNNQNDPGKKYLNTIFVIETSFTYTNENGDKVEGTSRDNYGGLRYFVNLDDNGNIIRDATGQPILERLWSGDGSGFGKLFALTQKYDSSIRSYSDFFNFWSKDDIKVTIKTQVNNFGGKQYSKNIITQIL